MLRSHVNRREVVLTEDLIATHLAVPVSRFGDYVKGGWSVFPKFDPLKNSKKFSNNDALMEHISHNEKINLSLLMMHHMLHVKKHRSHALPYRIWLSKILKKMGIVKLKTMRSHIRQATLMIDI